MHKLIVLLHLKKKYINELKKKKGKFIMWYDYDDYRHDDFEGTYAHDVAGYDDDTIYDAFEGDSDAYWNID